MRYFSIMLMIVSMAAGLSFHSGKNEDYRKEINALYLKNLSLLKSGLARMDQSVAGRRSIEHLKSDFLDLRRAFKSIAVITDYFNPLETKLWNSPAIPRVEEGSPKVVIDPHGYQKLEELVWADRPDYGLIAQELRFLNGILGMLENEPDRLNKFRNELVWDALYTSLIRMISLGISGFDSPVAMLSLKETEAVLESYRPLLNIYRKEIENSGKFSITDFDTQIQAAKNYLRLHPDFNQFDRMEFIRNHINPLTRMFRECAKHLNYNLPDERRSLKSEAGTIFDRGAFDIGFFSPNRRYQLTPGRIALGKQLFYDPQLSGTGSRSCASCHKPELAFTDGLRTAVSLDVQIPLKRNTPTLLNAVFQTRQFYDSRQTMLEFQVNDVIHNIAEMKGMLDTSVKRLKLQDVYLKAFHAAYPGEKEPVTRFTISNAIASYVRSLTSMDSRFDRYMREETGEFSETEKLGFNLFMGKAKCGTCHFMPLFNGLVPPFFTETESEVLGVPASKSAKARLDADSGKYYFTRSPIHVFSFKTPTVRNSTLTAPYMHNGVFDTMEEVLEFYNKGGGEGLGIAPANQTLPPDKLRLSKKEKKALVAFLKTLEDTSGTVNGQ